MDLTSYTSRTFGFGNDLEIDTRIKGIPTNKKVTKETKEQHWYTTYFK